MNVYTAARPCRRRREEHLLRVSLPDEVADLQDGLPVRLQQQLTGGFVWKTGRRRSELPAPVQLITVGRAGYDNTRLQCGHDVIITASSSMMKRPQPRVSPPISSPLRANQMRHNERVAKILRMKSKVIYQSKKCNRISQLTTLFLRQCQRVLLCECRGALGGCEHLEHSPSANEVCELRNVLEGKPGRSGKRFEAGRCTDV